METGQKQKNKHREFTNALLTGVQKIICSIDSAQLYEFVDDNVSENEDALYPAPIPTEEEMKVIVKRVMSSKELRDSLEGLVIEYLDTMKRLLDTDV